MSPQYSTITRRDQLALDYFGPQKASVCPHRKISYSRHVFSFLPPGPQLAPLSKGLQNVWSANMLSHIHCIRPEDPLCIKGCARLCPAQKDPLHVPVAASAKELWNSLVKAQLKSQLGSNILPGQGAALQSAVYEMNKSQCCVLKVEEPSSEGGPHQPPLPKTLQGPCASWTCHSRLQS